MAAAVISRENPGTIVPPAIDHPAARHAAEELAYWLAISCGAHPALAPERAPGPEIVLECGEESGREWFEIEASEDRLVLRASRPRALLRAVYWLLEQFAGAVWLGPCVGGEGVPRLKQLAIPPGSWRVEARFAARAFTNYPDIGPEAGDFARWMVQVGFNRYMVALNFPGSWHAYEAHLKDACALLDIEVEAGHHTLPFWLPPEEFFAQHPDWFALIDGQRRADGQLCFSSVGAAEAVAARICEFLNRNPEVQAVGVWPRDGRGFCQCPDCRKLYGPPSAYNPSHPSVTDAYMLFLSRVAERVGQRHPQVELTGLAYVEYADPPRQHIPPENVSIYFAPMRRCFKHRIGEEGCARLNATYARLIEAWRSAIPGQLYLFGYWLLIDTCSLPYPTLATILPELDWLEAAGADGYVMEYVPREWLLFGHLAHLIARGSFKPKPESPAEALGRLWQAMYGPAAEDVGEFWAQLDRRIRELGPCTGHYDLTWTRLATHAYLRPPLEALGRARARAAASRHWFSDVNALHISAELLLRMGELQRLLARLEGCSDLQRPRLIERALSAAEATINWAERHRESGAIDADKVIARVRQAVDKLKANP